MRKLYAVLAKELVDHLRDRRSIGSAFIYPVLGPLMFIATFTFMASMVDTAKPVRAAMVRAHLAPNLLAFLQDRGVELTPADQAPRAQLQSGDLDAVLLVAEDYPAQWRLGRPGKVELMVDRSKRANGVRVHRLERLLAAYSGAIATQRLLARGVSPLLAQPLDVQEVDLSTPERQAGRMLGLIPLFLMVAAFLGGMNVAIDATAGERERGSLEPLLTNPVTPSTLVLGKWLTSALFGAAIVGCTLLGFFLAMDHVPLGELGLKVRLGGQEVLALFLLTLPLALFAAAFQVLAALFARSFKEAQTYLSLFMLIPVAPGAILMLAAPELSPALSAVPVVGHHLLAERVLSGEGVPWALGLFSATGALLPAALCLWAAARLLGSERIVYGR